MTWININGLLNEAMSVYTSKRTKLMRSGKYTSGDHYQDGYTSMLYETIKELSSEDEFYPLDELKTRSLIGAFNRITGENVPSVWDN